MNGTGMFGRCEVCGKEGPLNRTYFRLPIKCDCHSPEHFDLVDHCQACVPERPGTRITLTADQAEKLGESLTEIATLRKKNDRLQEGVTEADKLVCRMIERYEFDRPTYEANPCEWCSGNNCDSCRRMTNNDAHKVRFEMADLSFLQETHATPGEEVPK